jgi:hypothetical protein
MSGGSDKQGEWQRVSKCSPCPICQKPDWCVVSGDGEVALCQRVESARRCGEGGWLHRLKDRPARCDRAAVRLIRLAGTAPGSDFSQMATRFQSSVRPDHLQRFARRLGLSADSLRSLGVGWSEHHHSWSFPMADARGNVLGIRLRRPGGYKWAVTGSKEGLFIPAGIHPGKGEPLLVTEGPTDAAALLDMGYRSVVGRPSCTGGLKLLVELVRLRHFPEVVIVADDDEPGRAGADHLAAVLVAYSPAVRTILPPTGLKDVRAWLQAGATRQELEGAIRAAAVRRLALRTAAAKEAGDHE